MAQCRNKGCTGHARKGQFFCYDCYQAWMHGGDDAVAARIEEMTKHTAELAELRDFRERVFDAVLPVPVYKGEIRPVSRTEKALFDVIHSGHYVLSKLRKEWYNSPDFGQQDVPKSGPDVRAERAKLMVDWYKAQLDKLNKPKPIVLETLRLGRQPLHGECGTACHLNPTGCPKAKCGAQCWAVVGFPCVPVKVCNHPAVKHPSAKTTDEAEPLRLKVAELEGKLQHAQKCLVGVVPGAFVKILATACLLAGVGFGFLLP